jgi:precorrin-6B methylase 2
LSFLTGAILAIPVASAQATQPRREPDVPFVPTTEEAVQAMLKLADVTKDDILYDLGCGDGRIVIAAAKLYGTRGVGIDINPVRIAEAKENARKAGVENLVRFEENDLFQSDIHEATVVSLFLLTSVNLKLRPKLLQDLKSGTRIVSNTFDMGAWIPEEEATVNGPDDASLAGSSPCGKSHFATRTKVGTCDHLPPRERPPVERGTEGQDS